MTEIEKITHEGIPVGQIAMIGGRHRYQAIECDYCRSLYRKLCNRQGKSRNPQRGTHIKVWNYVLKQCTACCGTNRVPIPWAEVIRTRGITLGGEQ